jgi:gamma-glutamyltranspeptidase / glutathione hydrolase
MNLLEALSQEKKEKLQENWRPWLVAVFAQIFKDRNTSMGDPDFIKDMPIKKWISKKEAKQEAAQILKKQPYQRLGISVLPSSIAFENSDTPILRPSETPSQQHTTHLSIIDAEGNAVAMTLTLNLSFGSCVTAGKSGVLMNDQMDDFSIEAGKANAFGLIQSTNNAIAPGKRPLSSVSPTLVTQKGKILLAIGSPGGPRIITSVIQTLARYFLLKEGLRESIAAPRLHYQGEPDRLYVEGEGTEKTWSDVQAVSFDPKTGKFEAVSDPRGQGKAIIVFQEGEKNKDSHSKVMP